MKTLTYQKIARIILAFVFLLLAGCKAELFSQLSENEANEMIALLLKNDVDAEKVIGKKGASAIWVDKSEIAQAVQLLKENGYPKEKFSNLGTVFTKEGLISSPLEERARYIYAVSQELSETFSNLDGVLAARVHVVLPEADKTGETRNPSSASVFIKYAEGANLQAYVPQIKLLVNNSIEGLDYEKISVVLIPAQRHVEASASFQQSMVNSDRKSYLLIGVLVLAGLLFTGVVAFFILKRK